MKAIIVYDSVFGNTEKIAKAIGDSIDSQNNVEVLRIDDMKLEKLEGINLLIVGSPTRAFRPTKAIADFLINIPANYIKGANAAAFDTRVSTTDVNSRMLNGLVKIFGYAAKPIAEKLQKKGGNLIASPEGFFVKDSQGPLKEGEIERAADWAKSLIKA